VFASNTEVSQAKEILAEFVRKVAAEKLATALYSFRDTHSVNISPLSANIISSSMTGAVV
jgi:hypothetical protein